jgi:hypothetical protein
MSGMVPDQELVNIRIRRLMKQQMDDMLKTRVNKFCVAERVSGKRQRGASRWNIYRKCSEQPHCADRFPLQRQAAFRDITRGSM